MRSRHIRLPLLLLATALTAACTSIEERFEKAEGLEAQGRYEQAAFQYIDILQREPTHEAARDRLRKVAPRAIEDLVADAYAQQRSRQYEAGLGALDRAERVRSASANVGVRVNLPDGVPQLAAELTEQTIERYRNGAEQHALAGRFAAAIQSYERALQYVTQGSEREDEFVRRTGEIHLDWAGADLDGGAYRAAYDRAGVALDLVGGDDALVDRAVEYREIALLEGTRPVAFLPLSTHWTPVDERVERMADDLATVLTHHHWAQPVPFVASMDPVRVSREARRAGHPSVRLEAWDGAEIGRVLGADFVVITEFLDLQRLDKDVSERRRPVRFKRGRVGPVPQDTAYVHETRTVLFDAAVAYKIVDAETRRILVERTVESRAQGRVEQAVFAGDYRDLELSTGARMLFEESPWLVEQELLDGLVDRLSDQVAAQVYADVVRSIP